ncbi:chloride channel protein [Actinomadura rifamycini]|uniref:chloride channel protein n=1 Tax=Actinomadura rifamycini TaxID=31962 RepID=UPI000403AB7F|nr:chloride channel protein [Actinomadura rifamycini]
MTEPATPEPGAPAAPPPPARTSDPRGRRARRARAALRWLVLAVATGCAAGLAAAVFVALLRLLTHGLLGGLAGFEPATTVTEGDVHGWTGIDRPWALPLITCGGALLASLIVARTAPETAGHGTDAAIDAAHLDPNGMRGRVPAIKTITAGLTLGSGGSGGTEGPIAQIGGALGSILSRRAGLTGVQARILVMTGLGAGVGAIFQAPLAGALLAAELLFLRGFGWRALPPALPASFVAFGVFGIFLGYGPMFGDVSPATGFAARDVVAFAVLGVLCGALGRGYAYSLHGVGAVTRRLTAPADGARRRAVPAWLPPAAGGLAVGLLGLAVPAVLGPGYGVVQRELDGGALLGMSFWLVLLLPLLKIAATSLSIGTGGSGGVFGPGLVIGGAAGAAVWRVAESLGASTGGPAPFVVVGMAVCLGAIVHAPFGCAVLVLESTRTPELALPIVLAMSLAYVVVGDHTLYRSQRERDEPGAADALAALRARVRRGRGRAAAPDAVPAAPADAPPGPADPTDLPPPDDDGTCRTAPERTRK